MLTLGIDLLIMLVFAVIAMAITFVVCVLLRTSQEQGDAAMITAAFVSMFMVLGYITMFRFMDWLAMASQLA